MSSTLLLFIATQANQKYKNDFSADLPKTNTVENQKKPKRPYRFLTNRRVVPALLVSAAACSLAQTTQGKEIISALVIAIKGTIGAFFLTTCYAIDCLIGNQPGLGR